MRYSRMKEQHTPQQSGKSGGFFVVLLIIAAAVYLICATSAGNWLSEKVLTPAVRFFAKDTDDAAAPASATVTERMELHFPAIEEYFLQAGIFSERENAEKAAEELKAIGGAGYVAAEEDGCRVIVSGYAAKADAQNVKDRLQSEREMQTKILELTADALTVEIETNPEQLTALQTLAKDLPTVHTRLNAAALELDKGTIAKEDAVSELNALKEIISAGRETVRALAAENEDAFLTALAAYLETEEELLDAPTLSESGAALSAEVKYAYVGSAYAYRELLCYDDSALKNDAK